MKANEAPEKIYIIPHTLTDGFFHRWFEEPFKIESIEYVHKDAFIEKACKFIKDNGSYYIDIVNGQLVLKKCIIKDFKKYMEGE